MEVTQYTFQSPYHSKVQMGTPVPSSKQEQKTEKTEKEQMPEQAVKELPKGTNETLSKAKSFEAAQKQEVQVTVKTNQAQQVSNVNKPEEAGKSSSAHEMSKSKHILDTFA